MHCGKMSKLKTARRSGKNLATSVSLGGSAPSCSLVSYWMRRAPCEAMESATSALTASMNQTCSTARYQSAHAGCAGRSQTQYVSTY